MKHLLGKEKKLVLGELMKKGQAAMEYLMTYGWAILIIIVVVAALYAMGVFKIGRTTVPCSPCFSYFAYVDHNSTHLVLKNGARDIENFAVTAGGTTPATTTYSPGDTIVIPLTGYSPPHTVTVSYDIVGGTAGHTDSGTLH